jgi:hypothetical protein
MTKNLAFAGLIAAALVGSAAFAQQDPRPSTVNQPVHKPDPPPDCAPTQGQPAKTGNPTPACVPVPRQAVNSQGAASRGESPRSSPP